MFYVSVCTVCLFENVGVGVCVWAEGGHILDLGVGGAGESVGEIEYGSFAWHCAGSRRERVEGILIEKIQESQEQFIICNHNGSETQRLIARFEAEPSPSYRTRYYRRQPDIPTAGRSGSWRN